MTRTLKLTGLILFVAIAATGCRFAHRRMIEHSRIAKTEQTQGFRNGGRMGQGNQFMSRGQGQGMPGNNFRGQRPGMRGGMGMGPGQGMRGGMGMGPGFGIRRGMGPMGQGQQGMGLIQGRIPNLTDKQRKEIEDLQQKQMQEMDKFREEMSAKMQSIRDANRSSMMNILTEEQKKFLESGPARVQPATPPGTKQ